MAQAIPLPPHAEGLALTDGGSTVNGNGWIIADGLVHRDDATVRLDSFKGSEVDLIDLSDTGVVIGSIMSGDGGDGLQGTTPLMWRCDG